MVPLKVWNVDIFPIEQKHIEKNIESTKYYVFSTIPMHVVTKDVAQIENIDVITVLLFVMAHEKNLFISTNE